MEEDDIERWNAELGETTKRLDRMRLRISSLTKDYKQMLSDFMGKLEKIHAETSSAVDAYEIEINSDCLFPLGCTNLDRETRTKLEAVESRYNRELRRLLKLLHLVENNEYNLNSELKILKP